MHARRPRRRDIPDRLQQLARRAGLEERGFESLWLPGHTHIPVSRRTLYPVGGELPREYSHTLVALAATVTARLRLATDICLLIERTPIVTAKEVAKLDLSRRGARTVRRDSGVG